MLRSIRCDRERPNFAPCPAPPVRRTCRLHLGDWRLASTPWRTVGPLALRRTGPRQRIDQIPAPGKLVKLVRHLKQPRTDGGIGYRLCKPTCLAAELTHFLDESL